MKTKYYLISAFTLSVAMSGSVFAKESEGKENSNYYRSGEAYRHNSHRQSSEYSLRGRERSEERHQYKKAKNFKNKHHDDDNERYERKFYEHKSHRNDDDRYKRKSEFNNYSNDELYRKNRILQYRKMNRYERQRYQEQYQNDPVGIIGDQNVNNIKQRVNQFHQKIVNSIDNKARELMGVGGRK